MTSTAEVGISPVLLQAITQTLSTGATDRHSKGSKDRVGGGAQQVIVSCNPEGPVTTKLDHPTHILHGMNEPVTSYATTQSGETIVVVQNLDVANEEQVEIQTEQESPPRRQFLIKNFKNQDTETHTQEIRIEPRTEEGKAVMPQGHNLHMGNLHMSNVLSAIATHLKNNRKRTISSTEDEEAGLELTCESHTDLQQQHQQQSQPIYISLPETSVPSPSNDITVNEVENVVMETVVEAGSDTTFNSVPLKKYRQTVCENAQGNPTTLVLPADLLQPGTVYQTMQTDQGMITIAQVATADSPQADGEIGKPCPICGDRISGYHYGIFTCESCKGFFKRTVQNKKAFICHRKGDCLINMTSRKKCPACRFKRCLLYGMRLEAIREDRMRGGRSSYEGCSPHGRTKPNTPPIIRAKEDAGRRRVLQISPVSQQQRASTSRDASSIEVSQAETVISTGSSEQVVTVVNVNPEPEPEEAHNTRLDVSAGMVPQTPQTLEDLLAVETLMAEDDEEQECCFGKLRSGDEDLFGSLLHLADHCLYRIVRWARNLPDFANVSTDDQILLLQSCWAELLCLSVCWNSVRSQNNTLLLSHGRELDLEMAKAMGLAEVIQRLLDFTEHLRRVDLDLHEYISLKVLMLMTPDVKNLKNEDIIRDYQERICEALLVYSITHFPHLPNKHCELLCRLTELTRTCSLAKDLLNARQVVGEVPPFSLLSELLKGDIIVQPSE